MAQERGALHENLPDLPLHLPLDIQVHKMGMMAMMIMMMPSVYQVQMIKMIHLYHCNEDKRDAMKLVDLTHDNISERGLRTARWTGCSSTFRESELKTASSQSRSDL